MSFLFSAIEISLFCLGARSLASYADAGSHRFLGRSIGLSPASTIITSHFALVDASAFVPGKLNFLDLISLSSTR